MFDLEKYHFKEAAITTSAIGVGISGLKAYQGMKQKKEAQNELNDYERQDLTNAFENVKISTVGTDLMREENQRTSANLVDASRNAGIRGILGGIPKIQASTNDQNREAQVSLDNQVQKREYAVAEDNTRLRGIKENRDNANIAALSSQIDKGEQDMWDGITGAAKGISTIANNADFSSKDANKNSSGSFNPGKQNFEEELQYKPKYFPTF